MSVNIIDTGLKFGWALTKRSKTTYLIIHHVAGENQSVEQIHNYHKNTNGWAGIGYNFYIRKDGTVYKGRGWEYAGGHTTNYNSISIGICFEGNYDSTSTSMPDAQYNAGIALITEALNRYPTITTICGHKAVAATACPGRYFPLAVMIANGKAGSVSAVDSTPSVGPLDSVKYVVATETSPLNCRASASTSAAILGQFAKGTLVTATKKNGGWLYVTDGAIIGWCSAEYLTNAVDFSVNTLVEAGVIETPGYWLQNYGKLLYLDQLLINLSRLTYKATPGATITTPMAAIDRLVKAGAINTPAYWIANYGTLQYLDKLLMNAANLAA